MSEFTKTQADNFRIDGANGGLFKVRAESDKPDAYSPVLIQHWTFSNDSWSANFQDRPVMAVIVTGCKPSFGDWIIACTNLNTPIYALHALYIAACVEWDRLRSGTELDTD